MPESSGSSNAASSSQFVHVELGSRTALVQLIALSQQCTAPFEDLYTIGGSRRQWRLFSSIDPYTVVSNRFRLATHRQTVAIMVAYYVLSYVQDVYMYGMCSCSIKASSSGVTNRWTEVDWTRLEKPKVTKLLETFHPVWLLCVLNFVFSSLSTNF